MAGLGGTVAGLAVQLMKISCKVCGRGFPERWPVPEPPGLLCSALMSGWMLHFEASLGECGGRQV